MTSSIMWDVVNGIADCGDRVGCWLVSAPWTAALPNAASSPSWCLIFFCTCFFQDAQPTFEKSALCWLPKCLTRNQLKWPYINISLVLTDILYLHYVYTYCAVGQFIYYKGSSTLEQHGHPVILLRPSAGLNSPLTRDPNAAMNEIRE